MIQVIDDAARTTPPGNQSYLPLVGQPVDARVPLNLLEAVRAIDAPDFEVDAELVHELRNKRFGLSETVSAQIRRYGDSVRNGERVQYDVVLALSRLIGRRPDADLVFRDAGRRLARSAASTLSATARRAAVSLPALFGRPVALRQLRKFSKIFLDGKLQRQGSSIVLEVVSPVSADAAPRSAGCGLYEAALRESLLTLVGADGLVEHVACRLRGDHSCQWRTDWRKR
ncbi:MAG: hypothetical protein ABJB66_01625 [Gemmatimonadaceae bacterium]